MTGDSLGISQRNMVLLLALKYVPSSNARQASRRREGDSPSKIISAGIEVVQAGTKVSREYIVQSRHAIIVLNGIDFIYENLDSNRRCIERIPLLPVIFRSGAVQNPFVDKTFLKILIQLRPIAMRGRVEQALIS